jgi:hypothetical protein
MSKPEQHEYIEQPFPHAPECGWVPYSNPHGHGRDCHPNCPMCHGEDPA